MAGSSLEMEELLASDGWAILVKKIRSTDGSQTTMHPIYVTCSINKIHFYIKNECTTALTAKALGNGPM